MTEATRAALARTIDTYCEAWSEPDPVRRAALLAEVTSDDVVYIDPRASVSDRAGLAAHIATILANRPGARVVRITEVDAHHGLARFGWRVIQADGTRLPESVDVVELAPDGRLARVVGFFGPLRPVAADPAAAL